MSKITTQQQVAEAVLGEGGGLWTQDKILLKLTEELGELVQALRKGTREQQEHELGDLGFALYCLAVSTNMSLHSEVMIACDRHKERSHVG